jgi:hypothetical protein
MSEKTTVKDNTYNASLVISEIPLLSHQHQHDVIFKERVASIDLRIGLNLLGEKGRMLLEEYIKTKTSQPAC